MPEPIGTKVFDVGSALRSTATFKVSGALTDPSTVTFKYKKPDGSTATWTYGGGQIVKSSTGVYYTVLSLDASGTWVYRWEGTGTAKGAKERMLQVAPTKF